MAEVSFPVEVVGGVPIVAVPEEIDVTNAARLRTALLGAAAHENGTLVVDMSRTQFCDSAGLHVLARAHKRAEAEGAQVLLVITAAPILRIFATTGIDRMIPTFSTLEQALAHGIGSGLDPPARTTAPADGRPPGNAGTPADPIPARSAPPKFPDEPGTGVAPSSQLMSQP